MPAWLPRWSGRRSAGLFRFYCRRILGGTAIARGRGNGRNSDLSKAQMQRGLFAIAPVGLADFASNVFHVETPFPSHRPAV
jgi:hypothetical protein